MRILRIIPSMNPKHGGPSQGIRNSIPAMKSLGVENEVVCFDNAEDTFVVESSFKIHALGNSKPFWAYNPLFEKWFIKHMCDYDVVVIHGLWLYHSYAAVKVYTKLKRQIKVPKIYAMAHGMLDPWFQRDDTRKLKALRNEIYWRLIEKKVVNSVDGILFTCEQEMLLARETFKGYRPKSELNVSYGIQTPPAYNSQMSPTLDKPYWLFLSRIHPKKGVDILIKAYQNVLMRNPGIPDLVIAGPIESEYAKSIIAMADNNPKIHFTGLLQGDLKWGAYYGAELFVLPSHQENFGIAVVEALACGLPVLISDQVNIWREVEDVAEICKVIQESINASMLNYLNRSEDEKICLKHRAREVYKHKFTSSSAAKTFIDKIASH